MSDKDKKLSPFDFLSSINSGKKGIDLFENERSVEDINTLDSVEKSYNAYMVNKGLSYHSDTILLSNEMNKFYSLPSIMQYDFLRNVIRPAKRYSKWFKAEKEEDVEMICTLFSYSKRRAREALSLMRKEDIETLRKEMDQGGIINKRKTK